MDARRNSEAPGTGAPPGPPGRGAGPSRALEAAAVVALAGLIAAAAVTRDLRQPFDQDELFTHYASQASGPGELFELLSSGGFDASPPLYVVAVWQARRLVGDEHLACRLPATAGFVVACLALYAFARRRVPATFAAVAMLGPAASLAAVHASIARPYGLMLGFSGLALLCWQAAAAGGRLRGAALAGLALSLAAATATHYYAVLLLAPLGLAELTRSVARRRVDAAVPLALAAALAPLPALRPLVAHARALAHGAAWLPVSASDLREVYSSELWMLAPLLLALVTLWLAAGRGPAGGPPCPRWEAILLVGLLALPAIAFALGVTVTRAFTGRYTIAYVLGGSLATAFLASALFRGRSAAGAALAGLLFAWLAASAYGGSRAPDYRGVGREVAEAAARAAAAGRRLAIPSGDHYAVYNYYAGPDVAARMDLVDLADAKHRSLYEALARWIGRKGLGPFRMIGPREFSENLGRYEIYGSLDRVRDYLDVDPLAVELHRPFAGSRFELFSVRPRGPEPAPGGGAAGP